MERNLMKKEPAVEVALMTAKTNCAVSFALNFFNLVIHKLLKNNINITIGTTIS